MATPENLPFPDIDGGAGKTNSATSNLAGSFAQGIADYIGSMNNAGLGPGNWGGGLTDTSTVDDGYPYGYGYGYGGGGGGGSSGPSDEQKKAFGNLGAIVGENADALRDQYDDQMSIYDINDKMNQSLRDANINLTKKNLANDWFRQHLKLQRVTSALNDRDAPAMRGSFLYDYKDLIETADDNIDAETLDSMRDNINNVLLSYFESKMDDVNNRNQAALNTEQGLRELYADYIAQGNNIHPDLVQGQIDTENHKLNGVDWLKTDFFDDHIVQAAEPEEQGLYRPDRAHEQIREQGLDRQGYNTASSAIGSYWERMNKGYDQRPRQA